MIATWMLYAAAVGGLITVAASAIDRVLAMRGRPTRFVWLAAVVATVTWPVAHAIQQLLPAPAEPTTLMPFAIMLQPMVTAGVSTPDRAALLDRGLLVLWVVLSAALAFRLMRGVMALRRTQRGWREGEIDGMRVRLSDNVGPAVVGLSPMDVVLPEWIVALDPHLRAIVLRHENEHRAARDPYLLLAAGVAVALMPWNVALWLQARRIRLAVEMDCDGRVLQAHPSPERYGMLMLTIAQRRSVSPAMFAPMLSEPTTQLERRIIAMRRTTHRRLARLTVYGGLTVAAGAIFVACALQSDTPTGPHPTATASKGPTKLEGAYFDFQVERTVMPYQDNAAPRYPDLLRAAELEGSVLAQFVVDTAGRAEMGTFKVLKSTHDLFTATVMGSLPNMHFHPALVGGHPVRQVVQMPFQFSLTKTSASEVSRTAPVAVVGTRRGDTTARAVQLPVTERHEYISVNTKDAPAAAAPPSAPKYVEFSLTRRATPLPDNKPPRYPDELRANNVEGEVLAEFVVDQNGVPDVSSFKVLRSPDALFTKAVRDALVDMRFAPAMVENRAVKQLLQMPFTFSLTR